jgi:hypothetical protein
MAASNIRIVLDALETTIEAVMKKVALDIVANLVSSPGNGYGTPVDTGWARANWVPAIGSPYEGTAGSKKALNLGVQQQAIATVATSYRLSQGPIYISNNVPYIVLLNEGSSKQAPAGFVQNAISKAVNVDSRRGLPGGGV